MTWRNFFKKTAENDEPDAAPAASASPAPATTRTIPPHLAQAIARRSAETTGAQDADPQQRKLAGLRRQRLAILFDIEQGELAMSPDNPWTQRIDLLTEAMLTVTDDLQGVSKIIPGPYFPLPATPVTIGAIDTNDPAVVEFAVGDQKFHYSEDVDWAERGHQITRSELVRRSGDVDALVPETVPDTLRDPLREHLGESLFVFASDLRDRVLDGEPLPSNPNLSDLAPPCPVCGGWTDWRGTCQNCARRTASIMALKREEGRLLDERAREAEERHRLVEGLPLARKRLRDVETDLARLGDAIP
jgi:hypothetical protein